MTALTIRICGDGDAVELRRVAERDSAAVPTGTVLGAILDGQLRAAISIETGELVADPFHPTAALVELLRARAAQLGDRDRRYGAGRSCPTMPQPSPVASSPPTATATSS